MTDEMNAKTWRDGSVYVSHNHQESARGDVKGSVYIKAGSGAVGAALDLDDAIELHEHLGEIIREVQEAKPKEPTAGEIIRALEPGTAFKTSSFTYFRTSEGVVDPFGYVYSESDIDHAFTSKIEVL